MRTYDEQEDTREPDTEITLGLKSILGIFFGLALICGVFFGFGYSLGRGHSATPFASLPPAAQPAATTAPPSVKTVVEGNAYNYIAGPGGPTRMPAGATLPAKPSASAAVVTQDSESTQPALVPATQAEPVPAGTTLSGPSTPKVAAVSYPAQPSAVSSPANIMVQIAAVSRPDDANVLVAALRKLGYDAFAHAEQGDNLLHIQVGPFSTRDQAEAMRARLLSEGYNAILK